MILKLTMAEEHYLKAICLLAEEHPEVPVKALAATLGASQPSVAEMLRKLECKNLLNYQPYAGIRLTEDGRQAALKTIRVQRLWEVFLVEKLKMKWDEVHEATEELEHVRSAKVIALLDEFLGYPRFDPHGDPIPDTEGNLNKTTAFPLSQAALNQTVIITGVTEYTREFLQHLDLHQLHIGTELVVRQRLTFDSSLWLRLGQADFSLSNQASEHILVIYSS